MSEFADCICGNSVSYTIDTDNSNLRAFGECLSCGRLGPAFDFEHLIPDEGGSLTTGVWDKHILPEVTKSWNDMIADLQSCQAIRAIAEPHVKAARERVSSTKFLPCRNCGSDDIWHEYSASDFIGGLAFGCRDCSNLRSVSVPEEIMLMDIETDDGVEAFDNALTQFALKFWNQHESDAGWLQIGDLLGIGGGDD